MVSRKVLKGRKGDTKKQRYKDCVPFEYIEYFVVQQRFFFHPVQQTKNRLPERKVCLKFYQALLTSEVSAPCASLFFGFTGSQLDMCL